VFGGAAAGVASAFVAGVHLLPGPLQKLAAHDSSAGASRSTQKSTIIPLAPLASAVKSVVGLAHVNGCFFSHQGTKAQRAERRLGIFLRLCALV
jgi:hypothetical protein